MLKTALALSVAAIGAISTANAITIPDSCLGCRYVDNADRFRSCLQDCLGAGTQNTTQTKPAPAQSAPVRHQQPAPTYTTNSSGKHIPIMQEIPNPKPIPVEKWVIDDGVASIDSPSPMTYLEVDFLPKFHVLRNEDGDGFLFVASVHPLTVMRHENPTITIKIDDTEFKIKPTVVMDGHGVMFQNEYFEKHFASTKFLSVQMNIVGVDQKTFRFSVKGIDRVIEKLKHK